MCVPQIMYTEELGAFSFIAANVAAEGLEQQRHVLAFADRQDASAIQALIARQSGPSSSAQVCGRILVTPNPVEGGKGAQKNSRFSSCLDGHAALRLLHCGVARCLDVGVAVWRSEPCSALRQWQSRIEQWSSIDMWHERSMLIACAESKLFLYKEALHNFLKARFGMLFHRFQAS